MTPDGLSIEPATMRDLDEVLAIEEACFSDPWTRKMLTAELSQNPFAHFLLAKCLDPVSGSAVVAGYFCFWIVFEEVRLMNLAVMAPFRRRGLATRLVCRALQLGLDNQASRAMLEVRASNEAAQALYRSFGFRETARRIRYYSKPEEDAVLMDLRPLVVGTLCEPSSRQSQEPGHRTTVYGHV